MSSKDLENICSSDEDWGESMEVGDGSNTPQTGMEVPSQSGMEISAPQATSPSVDMAESNGEVEMREASEDAEMKDLSAEPEDLGELKSPSPTVEMKSPTLPVEEMKESEECELLKSPAGQGESSLQLGESSLEETKVSEMLEPEKTIEPQVEDTTVPELPSLITESDIDHLSEPNSITTPVSDPNSALLLEPQIKDLPLAASELEAGINLELTGNQIVDNQVAEIDDILKPKSTEKCEPEQAKVSECDSSEIIKTTEQAEEAVEPEKTQTEKVLESAEEPEQAKASEHAVPFISEVTDMAATMEKTQTEKQFDPKLMEGKDPEPSETVDLATTEEGEPEKSTTEKDSDLKLTKGKEPCETIVVEKAVEPNDMESEKHERVKGRDTDIGDESEAVGNTEEPLAEIELDKKSKLTVIQSSEEPSDKQISKKPESVATEKIDVDPKETCSEDVGKSGDIEMKAEDLLIEEVKDESERVEDKGDDDSRTQLSFDDSSQMSGKEVDVDNMEDVTVPGGADGHVNVDEESGDDPLNDKSVNREVTRDDPLLALDKEEISILPDTSKPGKDDEVLPPEGGDISPPGSAEGDEILPDTKKKSVESSEDKASPAKDKQEVEIMEIDDDDDDVADDKKTETVKSDDIVIKTDKLTEPVEETCEQCKETKQCEFKLNQDGKDMFLCVEECYDNFIKVQEAPKLTPRLSVTKHAMQEPIEVDTPPAAPFDLEEALKRKCGFCNKECGLNETNLNWETMDFCNEDCLGAYQKELGSFCANCRGAVSSPSMGKYCVRFGFNVRQFCSSSCLEEYKKGLKVCSYCQKDISIDGDGFLAPMGDKGQFKDFCSQQCMQEYDMVSCGKSRPVEHASCSVCTELKDVKAEVLLLGGNTNKLCSQPCLAAFKFANNVHTENCTMCKKHFDVSRRERQTVYFNDIQHHFCSKICLNVNTLANRKIVACNWCKVKKYNFDMIRKNQQGQPVMLCSLNCLALYQVSLSASSAKMITCDHCAKRAQGLYHLTMSDTSVRNFCSYQCCMTFQSQFSTAPMLTAPTPTGGPTRYSGPDVSSGVGGQQMPVITSVTSLAPPTPIAPAPEPPTQIKVVQQVFVKPAPSKEMVNKTTQCRPNTATKGVSCRPICSSKGSQTDDATPQKILIPIPVPIYVPVPVHMFSMPFPVPVPFPLPIPVPIFIPTTRNTAKGIRKELRRIQEQIPRDPFEAELLMMAEMVAEDKTGTVTSSDSEDDNGMPSPVGAEPLDADSPVNSGEQYVGGEEVEYPADSAPSFGEDMLQMALKMASELTEPSNPPNMDMETAIPVMPTPQVPPPQIHHVSEDEDTKAPIEPRVARKRGRTRGSTDWAPPGVQKRTRTNSQEAAAANQLARSNGSPPAEPQDPAIEADPSLSLKYTYGVLAFRKWIRQKNVELTAKSGRAAKLFKTDILQLSTDELNFALCMFVKEVRKPDGEEYAPDIIYYLCLGIQLYLYRSHRIDNIFTDAYYEKFTESLNDITHKFVSRLNDRALVTRVEEEHLWESQQLGAHSPHVLLFTLMFFNTKHFLLTEVEDHMRLSFTHVMKHWKRNHAQPGKTGSTRNVLLRYYPPQSVLDADERKKKVYEQQENEQNPLRCPVKLYEFYVSKCPESVRGRNDVFYLLPERSCVPDSPVWYSTMALPRENISKMLNRIRMVREVLALLHSLNY